MIKTCETQPRPITTKNLQASAIIECMHTTLGDAPRAFELNKMVLDEKELWVGYLSPIAWALRSAIHAALEAAPAELVFGRGMILPIEFEADWEKIRVRWQAQTVKDNVKKNKSRLDNACSVGDRVLTTDPISTKRKLERQTAGPFIATRVYDNGTIRIQKGSADKTINI